MTRDRWIAVAGLLLGSSLALAFEGPINWDGKTYDYGPTERYVLSQDPSQACGAINGVFKTKIACDVDRHAFDKHFQTEKAKPRIADRDPNGVSFYCKDMSLSYFWTQPAAGSGYLSCPACDKEFASKVKKIVCSMDEKAPQHRLALKDGTLSFVMSPKGDTSTGWLNGEMSRVFPAYKKHWDETH